MVIRMDKPTYTHITLECSGCPFSILNSLPVMRELLRSVARKCDLHVVKEGFHRFRPQGITGYLLLRESHISVHTWPETGFALIDVLSCRDIDVNELHTVLSDELGPKNINLSIHTKKNVPRPGREKSR